MTRHFALILTLLSFGLARGQSYTFTRIADNTGPKFSTFDAPTVNASGTVAYHSFLKNNSGEGIYSGIGGVTIIAETGGVFGGFVGNSPAINVSGVVAFHATLSAGGQGIYSGSGGAVTTIVDTTNAAFTNFAAQPSINSAGVVAFGANKAAGGTGIYTGTGGALTTVVESGAVVVNVFAPSINTSGTIAFNGTPRGAGGVGIFTIHSGVVTMIDSTATGGLDSIAGNTPINSSGLVAYVATKPGADHGVYAGNGATITTIADSNSPVFGSFNAASVNSSGVVAFLATRKTGGEGIYTGTGGSTSPVIQVGDPLDGSTVSAINFGTNGLNDTGMLAFEVVLADGREGVYIAVPVPEPTACLGFAVTAGLIVARFRRFSCA